MCKGQAPRLKLDEVEYIPNEILDKINENYRTVSVKNK